MRNFLIALQFFTRIPINKDFVASEGEMGATTRFFPLVGLVIGLILFFIFKLSSLLLLPHLVVGAIIVIGEILITGGLHLDGYLDAMDGLLSSRSQDRALEIMKDSRVGAHGVTAFFSLFLIKYSVIVGLVTRGDFLSFILMPVIGRWIMLFCVSFFPYARNDGLGKIFWQYGDKNYWYLFSAIFLLLIFIFLPLGYLLASVLTYLIMLTPLVKINNYLNGHTGDTYGAVNEMAEVLFVFLCLLLRI